MMNLWLSHIERWVVPLVMNIKSSSTRHKPPELMFRCLLRNIYVN
jgi:hypothetical protein